MKVGCADIFQNQETLKCFSYESSIYSAAVDLAMNNIANYKSSQFIIYLDSKSVLLSWQNTDVLTFLITKLLNKMECSFQK